MAFEKALRQLLTNASVTTIHRGIQKRASVALIFRQSSDQAPQLGMIRRAIDDKDPWSGQMAFPGGGQDASDAHLEETAIRETQEEIGIDLKQHAELIGPLNQIQARKSAQPMPLAISPFVYWLNHSANLDHSIQLAPNEVHSFHWIDVADFLRKETHTDYLLIREKFRMKLPALKNHPVPIWGLSYLILKDLFDRILLSEYKLHIKEQFGGNYHTLWRGYPE